MGLLEDVDARTRKLEAGQEETLELLRSGGGVRAEYLSVASLAVKYDVSKSTIRDILHRIEARGIAVERIPTSDRGDLRIHAAQFHRAFASLSPLPSRTI